MDHQITHPTKEQVRAYMMRREAAHRPPPAPAEIRRQLGCRLEDGSHDDTALLQFCLLCSACSQLTAQLLLDWMYAASRAVSLPRSR